MAKCPLPLSSQCPLRMQPAKRGTGSLWSGPLQGAFCQAGQGDLWDFASVWAAAGVRGRAGLLLAVAGPACR